MCYMLMKMEKENKNTNIDMDWESRRLCVDESCIGVVGPDGLCKECGKPFEGDLASKDTGEPGISPAEEDVSTVEEQMPGTEQDTEPGAESESQADLDWEDRILCVDESCIGVVGPDGRCKECGKPLDGEQS